MASWLTGLASAIILKLVSWGVAWALAQYHQEQDDDKSDSDIDSKLKAFKDNYNKTFDGSPMTEDKINALKKSISDFLRNSSDTGGV